MEDKTSLDILNEKVSEILQQLYNLKGENELLRNEVVTLKSEGEMKDREIEKLTSLNTQKDQEIEEIVNKIESILD
ncbi:MAG: hypothetical protein ABXS93_03340 [Sulfurimonas sp.]